MAKLIVGDREYDLKRGDRKGVYLVDGREVQVDAVTLENGSRHLLIDGRSYVVEVAAKPEGDKSFIVRVNNRPYDVAVRDRYDALLHRLGMDAASLHQVNDLKAPMPGMVVAVHVKDGQAVVQGDLLVTLEAMKMENTLKSVGDGTVARVHVEKGQAVEKNEVLVSFA